MEVPNHAIALSSASILAAAQVPFPIHVYKTGLHNDGLSMQCSDIAATKKDRTPLRAESPRLALLRMVRSISSSLEQ